MWQIDFLRRNSLNYVLFIPLFSLISNVTAKAEVIQRIRGATYDYRDIGQHCIPIGCRSFDLPGRITLTRDGKGFFYFPSSNGGYIPQGFAINLNRTVSVPRKGVVPPNFRMGELMDVRRDANFEMAKYLNNLTLRDGSIGATSNGVQTSVVMNLTFQGPVTSGSAIIGRGSADWQINYLYTFDQSTGAMTGGSANLRVNFNLQLEGTSATSVQYTSDSKLIPARREASNE